MQVTTLTEIETALEGIDPDTLRDMASQLALSHVSFCEVTSRIGDCAHTSHEETQDRIDLHHIIDWAEGGRHDP